MSSDVVIHSTLPTFVGAFADQCSRLEWPCNSIDVFVYPLDRVDYPAAFAVCWLVFGAIVKPTDDLFAARHFFPVNRVADLPAALAELQLVGATAGVRAGIIYGTLRGVIGLDGHNVTFV